MPLVTPDWDRAKGPDRAFVACFPSDDRAFSRLVTATIQRVRPASPSELEQALRRTHPLATVRHRELSGEHRGMWYVYRDGAALARWATGSWWQQPGTSRVRLDAEGRFVEADEEAHRIVGAPPGSIIGRSYQDVALPGDVEGVQLMWRALAELGRLDTVYTVADEHGEPVSVEVHAEVTADGVVVFTRRIRLVPPSAS